MKIMIRWQVPPAVDGAIPIPKEYMQVIGAIPGDTLIIDVRTDGVILTVDKAVKEPTDTVRKPILNTSLKKISLNNS